MRRSDCTTAPHTRKVSGGRLARLATCPLSMSHTASFVLPAWSSQPARKCSSAEKDRCVMEFLEKAMPSFSSMSR
tara:strand:+ start:4945 stop:5169 length:225 start_codon:yes stop_codon:yes gene_type:complete